MNTISFEELKKISNPIIVDTTVEITQVIITNPTYVKMQSNQPISSIISLISLNANAFEKLLK